jgi:hypothetical protein
MRRVVFESKKHGVHTGLYAGSGFLQMLTGALAHKAGIGLLLNGRKFGVYWFESLNPQTLILNKAGECDEWTTFNHIDHFIVFSEPFAPDNLIPREDSGNGQHESEHQPPEEPKTDVDTEYTKLGYTEHHASNSDMDSGSAMPLGELTLYPTIERQSGSSEVWEHFTIEGKDGASLRCVRLRDDLDEETRQRVMGEFKE